MNLQDMNLLYDYNYWANGKMITAAAKLTHEQFIAPTSHNYGSLRGTLVHLLDTEYGWRMLCQHNTFAPDLNEADYPTLEVVAQRWREEEKAMRDYLRSLTDQDLTGVIRYTIPDGQTRERILWHCLLHVVNHGTQHRSEAAAILTSDGQSPGDMDFTLFLTLRG